MNETRADETTDERRIDYEYRAEAPVVPTVGTPDGDRPRFRITGTPELAETPERPELIERWALSVSRRREVRR